MRRQSKGTPNQTPYLMAVKFGVGILSLLTPPPVSRVVRLQEGPMNVIVGVGGLRSVDGTWEGVAEKSLAEVLTMAHRLSQLPAFDLERDGIVGDTGWLSVLSSVGDCSLVYFNGTSTARFEWFPSQREPGSELSGLCNVEACREAIRNVECGESARETLLRSASEVEAASDQ